MATKKINVKNIVRDARTQMRQKELDPAVVNEYALAMENGDEFPDITVFSVDGKSEPYVLADGWYRTAATEKCYNADPKVGVMIRANVRKGDIRDAILYAVGANSSHGVQRTNADKRKAVETLIRDDEWTGWADTVIAKRANVSQPFVSSRRRALENLVEETKGSTQNVLTARPEKRTGLDGVERNTRKAKPRTSSKGAKKTAAQQPEPEVVDRRRVTEASDLSGPAPGMIGEGKKEKPIAELLDGKALIIMFQFLPKVPGVSAVVHRNDPPTASRAFMKTEEMPRMPEAVLKMIAEQLERKVKA